METAVVSSLSVAVIDFYTNLSQNHFRCCNGTVCLHHKKDEPCLLITI